MPKVKIALSKVERQQMPRHYNSIGALEAVSQVQVSAEVPGRRKRRTDLFFTHA